MKSDNHDIKANASSARSEGDPTRRDFGKSLLAGAAGGATVLTTAGRSPAQGNRSPSTGPKLCIDHVSENQLTDEYLAYLKALGVECIIVGLGAKATGYEDIVRVKRRVEDAGFKLPRVMSPVTSAPTKSAFADPGRDEEIKSIQEYIRNLGRAGVEAGSYNWLTMGAAFQTGTTKTRGCETRLFEAKGLGKLPKLRDRDYSEEELWANYEYWLKRVLPVAEDSRVRLALHPNDPPVDYQGVPRLFKSRLAYRRAMEMSNHSPSSGLLFCVGCWSEMSGPDGKGEDIVAAIHEFGSRGHIIDVHFRNVSNHLPDFYETFPDNGYTNMYRIMRALGEVDFNGTVVPDHVPAGVYPAGAAKGAYHDPAGEAFCFGYIRAMIQAMETELGRRS